MGRHKTSTTVTIRVKIPLKARIDVLAQKSLLSVNAWCVRVLERAAKPRGHKPQV